MVSLGKRCRGLSTEYGSRDRYRRWCLVRKLEMLRNDGTRLGGAPQKSIVLREGCSSKATGIIDLV